MMGRSDPIERWRDISRAAAGGGFRMQGRRPRTRGRLLPQGAVALAILIVGGGLVTGLLRPSVTSGGPVVGAAEDGVFRLELTTPKATYTLGEPITPVASLTYLGPDASVVVFHATSPVGFRIEEVGGARVMSGATRLPCRSTELTNGAPARYPFAKSGDPAAGFDQAWYEDPVLTLPAGTWRISAMLSVELGDCGGEGHELVVENEIHIAEPNVASSMPSSTPSATPSPRSEASMLTSATDEDDTFRLTLETPTGTYTPEEAIEPVARITFLGPDDETVIFHGSSPLIFDIQELGGDRGMGGAINLPCLNTPMVRNVAIEYPFEKSGGTENGFDAAWYGDPVLRLPVGTWRISARLSVDLGDCGRETHELAVENIVSVISTDNDSSSTPPPTESPSAEVGGRYPEACATFGFTERQCRSVVAVAASEAGGGIKAALNRKIPEDPLRSSKDVALRRI